MAATGLLNVDGRPAEIVRTWRKRNSNPKWGWVNGSTIRFLDGLAPPVADVTAGRLAKAKAVGETTTIFWRRVDALLSYHGPGALDRAGAMAQARAELEKGVLTEAAF